MRSGPPSRARWRDRTAIPAPVGRDSLLVEQQLLTKLQFEMELSDFTVNLFRLGPAQVGKLAKPLDYGAFSYPDLMRKVLPAKVNYKP